MSQTLYQFTGERLGPLEWCDPARGELLVADSWRVEDGKAVALEKHRERFSDSAKSHGIEASALDTFFSAVIAQIPRTGSWFPRVEVVKTPGGPTLRYRERPAPPWSSEVVLAITPHDPRSTPLTKGPDLDALMALRQSVSDTGATEAAIVTADGSLVEGAYSTLAVWRAGSSRITFPPPHLPRIPSVTESVVREIAATRDVPVEETALKREELAGAEIWVLSALHGIRLVTAIVDGPALNVEPGRRDEWQSLWWSEARSL